jgi:hypothetical protein
VSGTADVNGDGKSDVIFTSDAGAHEVWEMNGTQVIADLPVGPNGTPASPPLNSHGAAIGAAGQTAHAGGFVGDVPGTTPLSSGSGPGGDAHILSQLVQDPHFIV